MTSRRIAKANQTAANNVKLSLDPMAKYENPSLVHTNPDDKIFTNIIIPYQPNGEGIAHAYFQQQFQVPILDVPEDYYMSIVRFSIPCQNIPIINFANYIQPYPNTNPDLTVFSVTLEYNGDISQEYVEFITETPASPPGVLSATNTTVYYNNPYYFTYTYTNILAMFNAALQTAFSGLGAPPAGSTAPYFVYDPTTFRIGLAGDIEFYDQSVATPIEVYVNYQAFSLFFSGMPSILFGTNEPNEQDLQLIMRNQYNNGFTPSPAPLNPITGSGYEIMWQEYPTLINMNSFKNLTVQSNLLPVISEFTIGQTGTQTNLATLGSVGILSDFIPLDDIGFESRGIVNYTPTGPYHLINLTGRVPIDKMDISIFWTDNYNQQYRLTLDYGQQVTMKFAFFKKSTFTS